MPVLRSSMVPVVVLELVDFDKVTEVRYGCKYARIHAVVLPKRHSDSETFPNNNYSQRWEQPWKKA